MIHTLENDQLRVKIADHGAELSEIYDKTNDRQVLWNADPAYWKRHAPVLFPNVGRYYEDHCLINGNSYTSGQHGFARDMEFTCTDKNDTSVTHLLESTAGTQKIWPYAFQLSITHTLNGRDLTVSWKVVNKDQETMYFTIGAHPAFNVPVLPDTVQSQYHLTFNGEKELTYCLLDPNHGTAIPDKTSTSTCLTMMLWSSITVRSPKLELPFQMELLMWRSAAKDSRTSVSGPLLVHRLSAWNHGWDAAITQDTTENCPINRASMYLSLQKHLRNLM